MHLKKKMLKKIDRKGELKWQNVEDFLAEECLVI